MPTPSFDIKAVEKELQGMFHQGFLELRTGDYEDRNLDCKHEKYCYAIVRAMEAYSAAINEEFGFRFNSRDYTDKTFYVTSTTSRLDLLSYYKTIALGQIISESAIQDIEKGSKLAAIIKAVSVFPEERSSHVGISVGGYIEPRPENFECYILAANLNCKVRNWFKSAAADYAEGVTGKLRQNAAKTKLK